MDKNSLQYQLYKLDNDNEINALVKDESIWLTQKAMGELFDCSADNISLHLKNIFKDGELSESSTAEDFSVVQMEGNRAVTRKTKFYNLDAIISVGYRVNSLQATRFRQWATKVLREYMTKGFVLDDERLKQPPVILCDGIFTEEHPDDVGLGTVRRDSLIYPRRGIEADFLYQSVSHDEPVEDCGFIFPPPEILFERFILLLCREMPLKRDYLHPPGRKHRIIGHPRKMVCPDENFALHRKLKGIFVEITADQRVPAG
jgi:hypothetical protein